VDEARDFKKEKLSFENIKSRLEEELKKERQDRIMESNDKDREQAQEIDKLRKEQLFQLKKTKAKLLALNDEQLQTTTKLTILQNQQLTTELEHQSKQTEQLIYKNNKMKTKIETLKRDVEIHKEVEKELAKRAQFC